MMAAAVQHGLPHAVARAAGLHRLVLVARHVGDLADARRRGGLLGPVLQERHQFRVLLHRLAQMQAQRSLRIGITGLPGQILQRLLGPRVSQPAA